MPTATFYRLPEEKRKRLIDACWTEVSQFRFSEISISRIISAAHIPRGSFYQYFEDKEELLRYLLEDMREYFVSQIREILIAARGDLFAFPLMAYDRFMNTHGDAAPMLKRFIKVLKLNQGLDVQSFMGGPCRFLPDELWAVTDSSKLRQSSFEYADHVFHMVCAVLAFAIVETLKEPSLRVQVREMTRIRVDMLRYGGAAMEYKEANE